MEFNSLQYLFACCVNGTKANNDDDGDTQARCSSVYRFGAYLILLCNITNKRTQFMRTDVDVKSAKISKGKRKQIQKKTFTQKKAKKRDVTGNNDSIS
jgi:hypothetical protein